MRVRHDFSLTQRSVSAVIFLFNLYFQEKDKVAWEDYLLISLSFYLLNAIKNIALWVVNKSSEMNDDRNIVNKKAYRSGATTTKTNNFQTI